jgi:hypothetical protein
MFGIALMELVVEEAEALGPDPEAFRGFYERALPRIYGYFLHRCGGPAALAEDLTQETFLAAVAELKKGRRVDTPIPWIYGIARHKLLDHYRRSGSSGSLRSSLTPSSARSRSTRVVRKIATALWPRSPPSRPRSGLRSSSAISTASPFRKSRPRSVRAPRRFTRFSNAGARASRGRIWRLLHEYRRSSCQHPRRA